MGFIPFLPEIGPLWPKRRKMKASNRKNVYRVLWYSPVSYAIYVIIAFSAAFILLLNIESTPLVTAIIGGSLSAGVVYTCTIIAESRLQKRQDALWARQSIRYLMEHPIRIQVHQIVSDWRDRKSVFPNQLNILLSLMEMLGNLAQICGISDREIEEMFNNLSIETEQKRYGNIIMLPPTLRVSVHLGYPKILTVGQTIEEWEEKIRFANTPKIGRAEIEPEQ